MGVQYAYLIQEHVSLHYYPTRRQWVCSMPARSSTQITLCLEFVLTLQPNPTTRQWICASYILQAVYIMGLCCYSTTRI